MDDCGDDKGGRLRLIPHNRLTYGAEEVEAVRAVVESGRWTAGDKVEELEEALRRTAGVKHAVCVASGLSALRLALKGLGVGPGRNVLVPAYSCVALANAVLACGGKPVPVDVTRGDWNLAVVEGERALRETRAHAAIAVNMFGVPAPIAGMRDWGIPVVEDCAHAFGAAAEGKPFGSRGDVSILSFHATKLLAGGEGGAVLTDADEPAVFVRSWRDYANKAPSGERFNDKMTDIEAALVLCQLARLPDMIAARTAVAERYDALLAPEAGRSGRFRLPDISRTRIWYRYTVEVPGGNARQVIDMMTSRGVCAARPVEEWTQSIDCRCPVADEAHRNVVSLPAYPTLTAEEQERVAQALIMATVAPRSLRGGP